MGIEQLRQIGKASLPILRQVDQPQQRLVVRGIVAQNGFEHATRHIALTLPGSRFGLLE